MRLPEGWTPGDAIDLLALLGGVLGGGLALLVGWSSMCIALTLSKFAQS